MTKIRIARLAAAAVGALLVSGAVVAITAYAAGVPMPQFAASPSPSAKPQNPAAQQYCQAYLNHFAKDLNKSTTTQAQADKVTQMAQNGPIPGWNGMPHKATKARTAAG